jgi:ribose transport system permease protein
MCRPPISPCRRRRSELDADPSSPYAMNDRLRDVEVIGLGEVDGPEDVILDLRRQPVYCSVRQGEIVRFLAPDHVKREVYAHVGGRPLGMAFDRDGGLVVCIAGMGLYRVDKHFARSRR